MCTFARETRLRSEPSGNAKQLAVLPPKTEVLILETEGRFCRVRVADGQDGRLEGYIASAFLQPLPAPGEEEAEEALEQSPVSGERKQRAAFPWPRFDRTSGWLALGLLLLLVTNLVTVIVLGRGIRDLQRRSYHVTCSGGGSAATFTWGRYYDAGRIDGNYFEDGLVKANFAYQVEEKLPGSDIILRHRLLDEEVWQEIVMQESSEHALRFGASLYVEPSATVEYQVLQRVNGENVRADTSHHLRVADQIGGDLLFRQQGYQNTTALHFWYRQPPAIAALQAKEILVKIDQEEPQELLLWPRQNTTNLQFWTDVRLDGFKSMTITVRYQDGEERTLELDHLPVEEVVIRR